MAANKKQSAGNMVVFYSNTVFSPCGKPTFFKHIMATQFNIFFPLTVSKSSIDGLGVYANNTIPARRKVGSLGGGIISKTEANKRVKALHGKSIAMVELWNGEVIDASVNSNELRYVNHCCSPNTYMRVCGYHVEFYALRKIARGEELTCDYGETHHDGTRPCTCGSEHCRKFI